MAWIDCGVNLPSAEAIGEFKAMLDEASHEGVERFVLIATNVDESHRAVEFAEQDDRCVVTVGVHPHQAAQAPADFIVQLKALAQHPRVRAIGECGLDFNRNFSPPDVQRRVFAAQLELAVETQLPVYLHERDALHEQLEMLRPLMANLPGAFSHCFTGGCEALTAYQALGCYIGITGWVCDERRGQSLAEAVPSIDAQRLLLETDAPYLLPRTLKPRPKSRTNHAKHVAHIGAHVAKLRGQKAAELAASTSDNAARLFGAW